MWIDIVFLLFAMYGMYLGFKKGILRTLIALASIFLGIVLALKVSPYVIAFGQEVFKSTSFLTVAVGFLITYFAIVAGIRLIGKVIEKGLKKVKLNFVNKAIGGMILTVFFVFVYSIVVWFADEAKLVSDKAKERSVTYPVLKVLPDHGKGLLEGIKPFFEAFWEMIEEARDDFDTE